ncbi:MAG: DEAD/DEAH box helicase [bacterium]
MNQQVDLACIVKLPSFSKGNKLFRHGRVTVHSFGNENDSVLVKGHIDDIEKTTVSLEINSDGFIIKHSCSFCRHKSELCEHVAALAIKYNEIQLTGSSLLEQIYIPENFPEKSGCEKIFEKTELSEFMDMKTGKFRDFKFENPAVKRFIIKNPVSSLPLLFVISPELFTINGRELRYSREPVMLIYSTDKEELSFSLPGHIFYFEKCGVFLNTENSSVRNVSDSSGQFLSSLLAMNVSISEETEARKFIAYLEKKASGFLKLSGNYSFSRIPVDNPEFIFSISLENKKIILFTEIVTSDGNFTFEPGRKASEHDYISGDNIFFLSSELVGKLKKNIRTAGFKLRKGIFSAPQELLAGIRNEDSVLNRVGKVVLPDNVSRVSFSEKSKVSSEVDLKIEPDEGWFYFHIKLPGTDSYISSASFVEALKQYEKGNKSQVVCDVEGNPVILENTGPFMEKMRDVFAGGMISAGNKMPVKYLPFMVSRNKNMKMNICGTERKSRKEYIEALSSFQKNEWPDIPVGKNSSTPLRSYQKDGVRWMMILKKLKMGGVLADEMGLGKTLQALTFIDEEKTESPALVIVPKTLIWSWDKEVEKFYPGMKHTVIDSYPPIHRKNLWGNRESELFITSYSIALSDIALINKRNYSHVILDEAQHIKNSNTKRFKAVMSINSDFRFVLTGTPLQNNLTELWSIYEFIMPGYLGSRRKIKRIEKEGGEMMERVAGLSAPFILRRTKKEMLTELPPITIRERPVEMTKRQKEIYLSFLLRSKAEFIEKQNNMDRMQILALITRLRLAANHPLLVSDDDLDPEDSGKIQLMLELLDEIHSENGRVLIFSQYVKTLKIIETVLQRHGKDYLYMDGSTKNRRTVIDKFQEGDVSTFLLSLKVGGEGLNLTAADNVILFDPWWNPAVEEQAFARTHRIGQKKHVTVEKFYSRSTIEEKILKIQDKKRYLKDFFMERTIKSPSADFIRTIASMEFGDVDIEEF